MSAAHRRKLSLAMKGRKITWGHKIAKSQRGQKRSISHRRNISRGLRARTTFSTAENRIVRRLRREGFKVLRNGWPDLFAFKVGGRARFVEVKRRASDKLNNDQRRLHAALARYGIYVEVLW